MKLQTLMIIFLIIIIPVILVATNYTSLQKDTIELQVQYDSKLVTSVRQAIEAFEVNTVEWNESFSRYSDSKRRDILASINAFTTSFSNALNVAATNKETILTYIPAMMYNLYTGYYIYTPTNVPQILNNEDGNAIIYSGEPIEGLSFNITPDSATEKLLYICSEDKIPEGQYVYTKNNIEQTVNVTTKVDDAVKEYKHILKTFVPYSEVKDDIVINYTLDNYLRVYTKDEARQGNLENISISERLDGKIITKFGLDEDILPEQLTERIIYYDNLGNLCDGEYNYVYNSNNEKCYYDIEQTNFFKITNNKRVDLYEVDNPGNYKCEYKVLSIIGTDRNIEKYYQVLNKGPMQGKWFQQPGTSREVATEDIGLDSIEGVNITSDYSAINYYTEAYIFTKWVNNLGIDYLKVSQANNPEDPDSAFNTHKKEVMKESIIDNLNLAISSYNAHNAGYEYSLPIFTYEDWEQILSNISMTAFLQGLPIGLKYYNNYAIAISSNNKEYINPEEIYYLANNDYYYHRKNCTKMTFQRDPIVGYKNTDFVPKSINGISYFSHAKSNGISGSECYYCLISREDTLESTEYTNAYLHAIARERYVQKK